MTKEMIISVIIPAYNASQYIERAIESVLEQTRPADEIIVVNDGSQDNTGDIVRNYADKVILIEQANKGVSCARNAGIEAATSDWIAFLDADDEWLPDKLKLQCEHLGRNPELSWTTGMYYNCECEQNHKQTLKISSLQNEKIVKFLGEKEFFESYFQAFTLGANGNTNTMLVRKDQLIRADFFQEGREIAEDDDLWLRLAYHKLPLGFLSAPLAVYHLGDENRATLRHHQVFHIETFLQRHLVLSGQAGMLDEFKTCATSTLAFWIRKLLNGGNGRDVRALINQYGELLNTSFRLSTYGGSYFPAAWNYKEKIKRKLRSLKKDTHGSH